MTDDAKAGDEDARRFRDAALPHIDDAYNFAFFLMRSEADAEAAVQDCYSRAQQRFDSFRHQATKPWLFAILRSVCYARLARLGRHEPVTIPASGEQMAEEPLWPPPEAQLNAALPSPQDGAIIRRLILALPTPFRETIVLCEFTGMSYRDIAEVVKLPIETVMSRLARARAMLLVAWKATDRSARWRSVTGAQETMQEHEGAETTIVPD
jgi:RNA polymerase sigma-70 factor (ECF subfamily)